MESKTREEFLAEKKHKKQLMIQKQNEPYEIKVRRAEIRAREFMRELDARGYEAHISVGGLDSITLLFFLRKIGIDIPAISVSALEDKSIQKVHEQIGVIRVSPGKSKTKVLDEDGFPVISKRIAGKIDTLQHPTEKNKTVRHAIITGECGAQGHYAKNSRMKLPKKWLQLFAGYENENEGTNYQIAPFLVSNKCCYYMKEKPCDDWAKEHNSKPFLGLMASEGGAEGRCTNRTRMQLFREISNKIRAVCTVPSPGSFAACAGSGSASAKNIWRNKKEAGREVIHNKGTKNGMLYVRIRNTP